MKRFTALMGAAAVACSIALITPVSTPAQAAPITIQALPSSSTTGYPTVRQGSTGTSVKILQAALGISADGSFGPATRSAVVGFQQRQGLTADGIVGPVTWSRLLSPVQYGSRGNLVKAVQLRLGLTADGIFGPGTQSAVKNFQTSQRLTADGVVGPATWGALLGAGGGGGGVGGPDTRYPRASKTYPNGQVPASQLCRVPGAPDDRWRISCRAIPDYNRLAAAYRARFGSTMTVTHDTLTCYRTVADQWTLYNKYGSPRAAYPGTSNHGWGEAIDVNVGGWGDARQVWMWANAPTYGFVPDVSFEQWHFHYLR